ncbi:MAG: 30S ribosomal protein S7 [bacterium]|jgi:small subunit ribosomal protein S7|nr:30S ribosomal protein S7 [bacterium]
MSRNRRAPKRITIPDPVYHDEKLTKFINRVMQRGKKSVAEKIVYGALDIIRQKTNTEPMEIFNQAMENAMPTVEVRPRRVGGATYQVPSEVREERRFSLGMRWILAGAKARAGHTMRERLADELIDTSKGIGKAVKKKEETHRMAEANKAFAHYRW